MCTGFLHNNNVTNFCSIIIILTFPYSSQLYIQDVWLNYCPAIWLGRKVQKCDYLEIVNVFIYINILTRTTLLNYPDYRCCLFSSQQKTHHTHLQREPPKEVQRMQSVVNTMETPFPSLLHDPHLTFSSH